MADVPEKLKDLQQYGVEFVFRPCNLKSHGKYFFVLQEYPSKIVITMDDDIIYRKDAIGYLMKLHHQNPDAVCARLTRKIIVKNGNVLPYKCWPLYTKIQLNCQQLALGVGGVLYPSKLFTNSPLFDIEKIKKYSFNADDLWLKTIELMLGVPVVSGDFESPDVALETSCICGLSSENVAQNANDMQWAALDKVFGVNNLVKMK